jgi:hypothetical protein
MVTWLHSPLTFPRPRSAIEALKSREQIRID